TSIIIDSEKYLVIQDGKAMEFPRKEFELLKLLCSSPGKVFSRSFIFEAVWGKSKSNERTVDVHILNIRKKLGEGLVRTIKGVGYKITTEDVKLKDIKTN
ncbi:MAG TPA: winged helix-turn-helix domain-containing protein, partial [Bacteroidia bacterium]